MYYVFEEYKYYTTNSLKQQQPGENKKTLKIMRYITPAMGYYPMNGQIGDIDPHSDM